MLDTSTTTTAPQYTAAQIDLINALFFMAVSIHAPSEGNDTISNTDLQKKFLILLERYAEMNALEDWQQDWHETYEDLRADMRMF